MAELADALLRGGSAVRRAGSSPAMRITPPLDEFSTSADHGFTQEPRAFLQSRTRFEPKTSRARTLFCKKESATALSPAFLAVLIQFWNGSSQSARPFKSALICSSKDFFRLIPLAFSAT